MGPFTLSCRCGRAFPRELRAQRPFTVVRSWNRDRCVATWNRMATAGACERALERAAFERAVAQFRAALGRLRRWQRQERLHHRHPSQR